MNEAIKPRIYKYDNVRLLAIVLVVIGSVAEEFTAHSDMFQSWFIFAYSFHAPLFIFLSGLFTKEYRDGHRPDVYKLSFYLVMGMILKIMIYLMRVWNGEDIGLDMFGGSTMEWYLFLMIMYSLTMYFTRKINGWLMTAITVVLGTAAGFFPLSDEFYLMRYFVFLPFFAAGYYLSPAKVRHFVHQIPVKLVGVGCLFVYFVLCFRERETLYPLRMLFTGRNAYALAPIEGCTFYHRLLCYAISAALILSVLACVPNRKMPVITRWGRNTLGVYFWHYPIVLMLWHYGVMDRFMPLGDPLWKFVVLTAAVLLALVLAIPLFTLPLRWLMHIMRRMPPLACLTMDFVVLLGAFVSNMII